MAQTTWIKPKTNIPFMRVHKNIMWGLIFIALASLIWFVLPFEFSNPNWGTSFEGGSSLTIRFLSHVETGEVRQAFEESPDFSKPSVLTIGDESQNMFVVRTATMASKTCEELAQVRADFDKQIETISGGNLVVNQWPVCRGDEGLRGDFYVSFTVPEGKTAPSEPLSADVVEKALLASNLEATLTYDTSAQRYLATPASIQSNAVKLLSEKFPDRFDPQTGIEQIMTVGADVGEKFRYDAIVSILLALGLMLLYIGIRFDARYAPAAVISLTVTTLITLGFVIVLRIEINLETVAAFLSLVGYGINDTIVTFDRVRENVALAEPDKKLIAIVNQAINECLSRTIITSVTTLLAIIPMAIKATGTTRDFAIIMSFGICVATFNSIFISCPMLLRFDKIFANNRKRDEARENAVAIQPETGILPGL